MSGSEQRSQPIAEQQRSHPLHILAQVGNLMVRGVVDPALGEALSDPNALPRSFHMSLPPMMGNEVRGNPLTIRRSQVQNGAVRIFRHR